MRFASSESSPLRIPANARFVTVGATCTKDLTVIVRILTISLRADSKDSCEFVKFVAKKSQAGQTLEF